MAGLIDEGMPISSNDAADGFYGETAKDNQLFQPNISAYVKKRIADNQVRDTKSSLISLRSKFII